MTRVIAKMNIHLITLSPDHCRPGECRTSADCLSWAPFCSEAGQCRVSDSRGLTLPGLAEDIRRLRGRGVEVTYDKELTQILQDYFHQEVCCDHENDRDNNIDVNPLQRKPKQLLRPLVMLTQRYVAPHPEFLSNQLNQTLKDRKRHRKQKTNLKSSLIDFDIFPSLRPPPVGDSIDIETLAKNAIEVEKVIIIPPTTTEAALNTESEDAKTLFLDEIGNQIDVVQEEDVTGDLVTISDSDCPGSNLRTCVEACIPLPLLWVYSVCVRECARRCP